MQKKCFLMVALALAGTVVVSAYLYADPRPENVRDGSNPAYLTVRVFPDAEIWFGGYKTQQQGSLRDYVSPALKPGKEYTYDIKATWMRNGTKVTENRTVTIRPGSNTYVDLVPVQYGAAPMGKEVLPARTYYGPSSGNSWYSTAGPPDSNRPGMNGPPER